MMDADSILTLRKKIALWLIENLPNDRDCGQVMNEVEEVLLNYLRLKNDLLRALKEEKEDFGTWMQKMMADGQ